MADPERAIFCIGCSHVGGTYGDDISIFAKENNLIPGFIAKEFIVHRSIANIYNKNGLPALFHAVETLDARYVVIVGHTNCEAIQKSLDDVTLRTTTEWTPTPVDDWLSLLTDHAERREITDADVLAEENVQLQIDNVIADVPNARKHYKPKLLGQVPIQKSPLVLGFLYNQTTKEWREVFSDTPVPNRGDVT